MGLRQRLSLAVAVLHEPQMLILDEPTSGVDPVARDSFWELLIDLSRKQGVTIFVTTHFMNEGMRCDRISLMHAGKVLACDAPQKLIDERGAASLEEAFIGYMEDAIADDAASAAKRAKAPAPPPPDREAARPLAGAATQSRFRLRAAAGMLAYARNETMQILRDPVRLAFAFVGSALLMLVFGFGITTDVEHIRYAALDLDQSPESRDVPRAVRGASALLHRAPRRSAPPRRPSTRLQSDDISLVLEIPPSFGSDLRRGSGPEVMAQVDGADDVPRRDRRAVRAGRPQHAAATIPASGLTAGDRRSTRPTSRNATCTTPRSRASTRSCPASRRCCCILIPAILMAVSIVREKELGSIINFYVTPTGQARVPARQAAPLHRDRHDQLLHPGRDGAGRLRRPDQGKLPDADAVHAALRHGDHRHRHGHLDLHQQPGRGRLRHRDPHHPADHPVLRACCSPSRRSRAAPGSSARSGPPPTTCTRAWAPSPRGSGPRSCWRTSSFWPAASRSCWPSASLGLRKQEK